MTNEIKQFSPFKLNGTDIRPKNASWDLDMGISAVFGRYANFNTDGGPQDFRIGNSGAGTQVFTVYEGPIGGPFQDNFSIYSDGQVFAATTATNSSVFYISPVATSSHFYLNPLVADPTNADGNFWYNGTDGRLKINANGTVFSLATTADITASDSLQEAYNVGNTIVTAGNLAVDLSGNQTNPILTVRQNGTGDIQQWLDSSGFQRVQILANGRLLVNTGTANQVAVTIDPASTGAHIALTGVLADPSTPTEGWFWYNEATDLLKLRTTSTTETIAFLSNITLQQAYNNGFDIDIDLGSGNPVTISANSQGDTAFSIVDTSTATSRFSVNTSGDAYLTPIGANVAGLNVVPTGGAYHADFIGISDPASPTSGGSFWFNTTDNAFKTRGTGGVVNRFTEQTDAVLVLGSIPFVNTTGRLTQDNANLFWDNTNKYLGIGTNTPTYPLELLRNLGVGVGEHQLAIMHDGSAAGLLFGYNANGASTTSGFMRSPSGFDLRLGAGASFSNSVFIDKDNGFVGIGNTTAPTDTLQVVGSIDYVAKSYASVYDTTAQTVAVAGTFQDITFNTNAAINGFTHTAGTADITCNLTGTYLIQFNSQVAKTGGANTYAELRVTVNGTELSGAQSGTLITNNNAPTEVSSEIITTLTAGQIVRLQLTGGTTSVQIVQSGSIATTRPSANITITRVI